MKAPLPSEDPVFPVIDWQPKGLWDWRQRGSHLPWGFLANQHLVVELSKSDHPVKIPLSTIPEKNPKYIKRKSIISGKGHCCQLPLAFSTTESWTGWNRKWGHMILWETSCLQQPELIYWLWQWLNASCCRRGQWKWIELNLRTFMSMTCPRLEQGYPFSMRWSLPTPNRSS